MASDENKGSDLKGKSVEDSNKEADESHANAAAKLLGDWKMEPIRPGDYVVRIHIIEARDLKGRGIGEMSDPVCKVEVMEKRQNTKMVKSSLNPVFDDVLYFEFNSMRVPQIEMGKIHISVFDANTFRRNVLIGAYEFDVATIYHKPHHEIYRQWVALTDVTDSHEGIQGYLKCSISVLGPGDEQHTHDEDEEEEEEDDGSLMTVLMPPHIEQSPKLLKVWVYSVAEIMKMDSGLLGGGADPYAKVTMAGVTVKTDYHAGQTVPILDVLTLPVMEPVMSGRVVFSLYDHDNVGSDDRISTTSFNYDSIKEHGLGPMWLNMYGAGEGQQRGVDKMASKMNRGYLRGAESHFRGRALIKMAVEDLSDSDEVPEASRQRCDQAPEAERPVLVEYTLQCDVYEGAELPHKKGDLSVELSIGSHAWATSSTKIEKGRALWYEEINNGGVTVKYPEDVDQCPRIYLYLRNKKHRLAFYSIPFDTCFERGWDVPPVWLDLKEDPSVDYLDDEFPGAVLVSVRVGRSSAVPPAVSLISRPLLIPPEQRALRTAFAEVVEDEKDKKVHRSPSTAELPTFGRLTVTVVAAEELPVTDRLSNSTDPYVKVNVDGAKHRTTMLKKNRNPTWNESFEFENVPISANIELKVKDHDTVGKDETSGLIYIPLRSQQARAGASPGEDWEHDDWHLVNEKHPNARIRVRLVYLFYSADKSKEVEAAHEQEKHEHRAAKNKELTQLDDTVLGSPLLQKYQLRVHVFQARNLPSTDQTGLTDPYVVVRCAGHKIKTKTEKATANPTWYKSFVMNIDIPTPMSMAPRVQVQLYDWDNLSHDDMLGRLSVSLESVTRQVDKIEPRWYQLYDWHNAAVENAEVLLGFQLLQASQADAPLPDIQPATSPKWIELTTLGLRDLSSLLGVHKTQIHFQLPHHKHFKTKKSMYPSSKNPNFLQVLKMPIDFPSDPLYAPTIGFKVKDTVMGGIITRVIGVASFNLQEAADHRTRRSDAARKREAELQKRIEAAKQDAVRGEEEERRRQAAMEKADAKELQSFAIDVEGEGVGSPSLSSQTPQQEPVKMRSVNDVSDDEDSASAASSGRRKRRGKKAGTSADDEHRPLLADAHDYYQSTEVKIEEKSRPAYRPPDEFHFEEDGPEYMKGRSVVDNELEDVMDLEPFQRITLHTGQHNAGILGQKYREVGSWKGFVRILDSKNEQSDINMTEILSPQKLFVRVYILIATSLIPQDRDGQCDPYLVVKLGGNKYSTRDRKIRNTLEPDFYESFQIPCTLPGDASLSVSVYDWDGIGDDLVGTTVVDIENRYFTKEWRQIENKPVEWRTLHNPTSSRSQGKIKMWVEVIDPQLAKKIPLIDITPPPPEEYEVRVVVWSIRDAPIKDEFTNQNDLYVTCECIGGKGKCTRQKTDTHLRSKKGLGNFNWRMKFPLELPPKRGTSWPRLRFQVWDKDFFSANDSICETSVSLKGLCKKAHSQKDRVAITRRLSERFWLEGMRHPNDTTPGKTRMEVSIEIMPMSMALELPAGFGRSDPNQNPFLPEPEGRVHFHITHPLRMLRDILGPELYGKLRFWFWVAFLGTFIYMTAPFIAGVFDIATKMIH